MTRHDAKKAQLIEAMAYLTDCLAFIAGPNGDTIFISDDMRAKIAWHLARAGAGEVKGQGIIKRRAIPDRPGQFAGSIEWVPMDVVDPDPKRTESLSAQGEPIDLDALDDALPWHVKTRIEGNFT